MPPTIETAAGVNAKACGEAGRQSAPDTSAEAKMTKLFIPLDNETHEMAAMALAGAIRRGQDPIEVLHRADLILNPAAETRIRLESIMTLMKLLEEAKPHELLRRKFKAGAACTPDDMVVAVLDFIREYWDAVKKEGP